MPRRRLASHPTTASSSPEVLRAPLALTSSGRIVINAYQLSLKDDLGTVIETALVTGRPIFIGVAVDEPTEVRELLKDIDDACADIVGRLGGRMQALRRSPPG